MAKSKMRGLARARELLANPTPTHLDPLMHKRRLVADLCRILGPTPPAQPVETHPLPTSPLPELSPRMHQTLERLLAGDSEKQIALRLGVSKNTVHVYVKALYRTFNVCSRGELLAQFIQSRQSR